MPSTSMTVEAAGQLFEMAQTQSFLQSKARTTRPVSAASEGLDTEFETDSETEDNSSAHSDDSRRRSATTVSSFDEVETPRTDRSSGSGRYRRPAGIQIKSIEGPRGPHLFRASHLGGEVDYALQLSPLLPKDLPRRPATTGPETTVTPVTRQCQQDFSLAAALAAPELDADDSESQIRRWTSRQVIEWMESCGMDSTVAARFELNDINGDVLLDLQFDHLRDQLDIQSFGKRHQLWSAICSLRGEVPIFSPQGTPFQDTSRPASTVATLRSTQRHPTAEVDGTPISPASEKKRRGRKAPKGNEIVTPAESVSIVAIEQLIPKPHHCHKGERCAKWRKQQRALKLLEDDYGIGRFPVSTAQGGTIYLAADPANAAVAQPTMSDVHKQFVDSGDHSTDTLPSIVASSDVLGPGQLPAFALHENVLGQLGNRDPQDNVRQFLNFQHVHASSEWPPSPPPELAQPGLLLRSSSVPPPLFPAHHHEAYPSLVPPRDFQTPGPHQNLRSLPRLDIPRPATVAHHVTTPASPDSAATICRSASVLPSMPYRLGSPQSEMDVPVTAIPLGPVARDTSQSVPPNMQYHQQCSPQRPASARSLTTRPSFVDLRRPSMPLPALKEGEVLSSLTHDNQSSLSPTASTERNVSGSSVTSKPRLQRSLSFHDPSRDTLEIKQFGYGEDCSHAGYMKKRKTKLLRHEWQDAHFRLVGSQLSMHENARLSSAAKEKINVDDYGVSCSTNVSSNKLSAAMKAFRNKNNSADASKADTTAFNFQLVPNKDGDRKLAASGKTHHFAVKTKDERIDWMRELMLSKARKQKGQGYEVEVNGEKF